MKAVMVMFDSLNRRFLPPYGCDWTHAPNFARLAKNTVTFTSSFVGSMPCMPARREIHTGRYNFLHRSWGPLEPFDDSMPEILKNNGVYTHLVTDHYHYWEDGGATYHPRYSSFEISRGQETDIWKGEVADPEPLETPGQVRREHLVNRKYMQNEEDQPQPNTFRQGLEFIETNKDQDNWFLQIETFDPHEPFFSCQKYKDLYPHEYDGPEFNWPKYGPVTEPRDQVEHCRAEYMALLSMCDHYLGKVLDAFDKHNLWQDTMLIVNTDHGFLLGEHDHWAKMAMPWYNHLANTPLFIWDPRCGCRGETRGALVQTIDLAPTLLDFFNIAPFAPSREGGIAAPFSPPSERGSAAPASSAYQRGSAAPISPPYQGWAGGGYGDMLGQPLRDTIANDAPVREAALFGAFGAHVNVTDGRYVYMRAPVDPDNVPLFNYTLMPTHMRSMFGPRELENATLAGPFSFTRNCPVLKTPASGWKQFHKFGTMLFDLESDPGQLNPIEDPEVEERMIRLMVDLMRLNDAPQEQYVRLGLEEYVQ